MELLNWASVNFFSKFQTYKSRKTTYCRAKLNMEIQIGDRVHRTGERWFDESIDLPELVRMS